MKTLLEISMDLQRLTYDIHLEIVPQINAKGTYMSVLVYKITNYQNADVNENIVTYILNSPYLEWFGSSGCFFYQR